MVKYDVRTNSFLCVSGDTVRQGFVYMDELCACVWMAVCVDMY